MNDREVVMNQPAEKSADYVPPMLAEVGEFNEDTLGDWNGTSPDWFFNYYW